MEKKSKNKQSLLLFGGGDLELRWDLFSPLKVLKTTLPLIALSLFRPRTTMLKYYVGCKPQKQQKHYQL